MFNKLNGRLLYKTDKVLLIEELRNNNQAITVCDYRGNKLRSDVISRPIDLISIRRNSSNRDIISFTISKTKFSMIIYTIFDTRVIDGKLVSIQCEEGDHPECDHPQYEVIAPNDTIYLIPAKVLILRKLFDRVCQSKHLTEYLILTTKLTLDKILIGDLAHVIVDLLIDLFRYDTSLYEY